MPKFTQDGVMGAAIILACLILLFREHWFLTETVKGQRLVRRFSFDRAVWVLRSLLLVIATLGALLAYGIVRPIRW